MKEPEDEAFDELAKRQGDWGLQGSRKHQIMRYAENVESKRTSMTPQQIDAMKLALEALEQTLQTLDDENAKPGGAIADTIWHSEHETLFDYLGSEITAIKEVLKEHAMRETQKLGQEIEQEPYSVQQAYAMAQVCLDLHEAIGCKWGDNPYLTISQLKASQPQRTWVGLTEQEHTDIAVECGCMSADWVFYGAAVERKLKERNT